MLCPYFMKVHHAVLHSYKALLILLFKKVMRMRVCENLRDPWTRLYGDRRGIVLLFF